MRAILTALITCFIFTACEKEEPYVCPTKTCFDFETWEEAQAAYEADSTCYAGLDANKNGEACEILKD